MPEADRPTEFGEIGNQWDRDGWLVPIHWSLLAKAIDPKSHLSKIRSLLPEKYSPIQSNGNQGCYLAEVSDGLGNLLLALANAHNSGLSGIGENADAILEEKEEARINESQIPETEKQQLIKARRGQGIFRFRVEECETTCRMTGIKDRRFLIASHIKPWRVSDNRKLDGNNGLLLSPHVDKLFDQGWISFSDEGNVFCASNDIKTLMIQWGLNPDKIVGVFNSDQKKYLAYHRTSIYRGSFAPTHQSGKSKRSQAEPAGTFKPQ